MNKQNGNHVIKTAEKKYERRDKKKTRSMKVSGAGVKNLERLINK